MCAQRDALRQRSRAAECLAQTCLAHVPDGVSAALELAFTIDPLLPPEDAVLLAKLDEGAIEQ